MPAFVFVLPTSDIVSVLDHYSDNTPGALLDLLLEKAHHHPQSAAPAVPASALSATANAISGTATLYCPSLWGRGSRDEDEALQVDLQVKTNAERSLGEGGMGVLTCDDTGPRQSRPHTVVD
jgi:hypothetical protein